MIVLLPCNRRSVMIDRLGEGSKGIHLEAVFQILLAALAGGVSLNGLLQGGEVYQQLCERHHRQYGCDKGGYDPATGGIEAKDPPAAAFAAHGKIITISVFGHNKLTLRR